MALQIPRKAKYEKHGMRGTPEYRAWQGMRRRCHDPKDKNYPEYGAKGVTVALEWQTSFLAFFQEIGLRPTPKHSVDRINGMKGYEPGNVRWATAEEQAANRRYCHHLDLNGETLTIQQAARKAGIHPMTLRNRLLKQGVPLSRAMTPEKLPYRSDSKHLTHNGVTRSVPEWAKELGIRVRTLRERLRRQMPLEAALTPGLRRQPTR